MSTADLKYKRNNYKTKLSHFVMKLAEFRGEAEAICLGMWGVAISYTGSLAFIALGAASR